MKSIFLTLISLVLCSVAPAQKVALVLSGGGAKGAAHLGAIKALEENNIPIDYIVGTSMGAVIGGFYAAGYTTEQMEKLLLSEEFQKWMSGNLTDETYFFSKGDDNASMLGVNVKVDSSLTAQFNSNFASDLFINFALARLLAQASMASGYDFDSLMIPYRAMASEIFTQEEVMMREGKLNDAIRASMTVPLFYRPIKFDGRYLFDGGVYNNFPVDVAKREFNPDVIIGVNVSSKVFEEYPEGKDDELLNKTLLFVMLDKTNPESVGENGVYLQPNLSTYTSLDFGQIPSIIDSGYQVALRQMPEIQGKVERRRAPEELQAMRQGFINRAPSLEFDKISLDGFRTNQREYVRTVFRSKRNEATTIADIEDGYFRLISEPYFRTVYPGITYDSTRKSYAFELMAEPKPQLEVDFGGNLASRSVSQVYLGLTYSHFNYLLFKHHLNAYNGRFYQSAQWKSRMVFPFRIPFYIEPQFTYNNWDYIRIADFLENVFDKASPTILEQTDRSGGIDFGFALSKKSKFVASAAIVSNSNRFSNRSILISTDTLDISRLLGQKYSLQFVKNSLNRKFYASRGAAQTVGIHYVNVNESYKAGNTALQPSFDKKAHSWFKISAEAEEYFHKNQWSMGYYGKLVLSNQPAMANYLATLAQANSFTPSPDSHLLFLQNFRSNSFVGLGSRNVLQATKNLEFRLEGYAFLPLERIELGENQLPVLSSRFDRVFIMGAAHAVYFTPAGPLSVNLNLYNDRENPISFLVNFGYLLFNKRAFD
ncbi:patatin-like phospholipase family protein [Cytophagales bacterium LB-30]|uniref:Patatin-like phospholipase family protein n=1 Tax=Shiella aurantiaca TaxID=3058365 RepID=A0ABT8F5U6_9BACT|nr:patatin-like phospholipase family protein [Shiella aurantiaca]MDN4165624.1 patatin-like phospholipase family protein [Shiella aurantiaca]